MKIRKSTIKDIEKIMKIYSYAREFMKKNGNPHQWGDKNWPPKELIEQDIDNKKSYVCLNDNDDVIGTFYFDFGKNIEPTYNEIFGGNWINDEPYGVIHRIAGDGSEKGIGAFCINYAYDKCKHIRIDTHEDNIVMQNLLKKLDFKYCGYIYLDDNKDKRLAYEKNDSSHLEEEPFS